MFRLWAVCITALVCTCMCAPAVDNEHAAAAPWPMAGHDTLHSSRATSASPVPAVRVNTPTLAPSWNITLYGDIQGTVAVGANEVLYVGTLNGIINAVDGATGSVLWNFTASGEVPSAPTIGSNGLLYASALNGDVYALDARTGAQVWVRTLSGVVGVAEPVVISGSVAYIAANRIVAVTANGGESLWQYSSGSPRTFSRPAVYAGVVYATSADATVHAVNESTGQAVWMNQVAPNSYASALSMDGNGLLYFVSKDNSGSTWLYCVNATDGAVLWRDHSMPYDMAPPAVGTDGTAYIGATSTIVAMRADHTVAWTSAPISAAYTPSLDSTGVLIACSNAWYEVWALDISTGAVLASWVSREFGGFTQPSLGGAGTVYASGSDGRLVAFAFH